MKILILGAGQTGTTLAEHLADEEFDITVVDHNDTLLKGLKDRLDIQTVHGNAARPDTLRAAGAADVDLLIAVTDSDEVNMVACQVCHSLFDTERRIARIRSHEYYDDEFFDSDHMPISFLINPERVVMMQIKQLIEHPGALQVLDFAGGRLQLVAVRAYHGGPLVGQALRSLREHVPNVDTKVVAIFRGDRPITPTADTVVQADDEVFFVAPAEHISAVMSELRQVERPNKHILIGGGGHIGLLLARALEKDFRVKVVELDEHRANFIAERLDNSVVVLGNVTNQSLLVDENVEDMDAFCAVTDDDEVNFMSALLAKRLGVRRVLALITKPAYVELVQGRAIDIAVSPQLATTSEILSHVRGGNAARVHRLRRGAAEAMEAIAHGGDSRESRVVGRRLDQLKLPKGVTVGAIVRGDEVIMAHDEVVVERNDHVVLFLVDISKSKRRAVERKFQVGLAFFD